MALTALERETTINMSDGDNLVHIWTAQRRVISRIRKDDRFTIVTEGNEDGTEWLTATIPADKYHPVTGAKRERNLTDEQRQELADRLARVREGKQ